MSAQLATVTRNVLSLRSAAERGSEQTSQAIAGDTVEILQERGGWTHIRTDDAYTGWVQSDGLMSESADGHDLEHGAAARLARISTPFADITTNDREPITRLVFGTRVRIVTAPIAGEAEIELPDGVRGYLCADCLRAWDAPPEPVEALPAVARTFLGTPYLWGGTTPFGFDCSGLVQRVYRAAGVTLPRDAYEQAECPQGTRIAAGSVLRAGDLVFFLGATDPNQRGITHVGMMIDEGRMIHAYGKSGVTIDLLSGTEILSAYAYRGAWRLG